METGSGFGANSQDQLLHRLELVGALRGRSSSKSAVSTLVSTAPACSILLPGPTCLRVGEARADGVLGHVNLDVPPASRSSAVWLTQTCVSPRRPSAWSRPPRIPALRARGREERASPAARRRRKVRSAHLGRGSPSPFGYCSVINTGTPSASATADQGRRGPGRSARSRGSPCGSPSCTSTTTSAARSVVVLQAVRPNREHSAAGRPPGRPRPSSGPGRSACGPRRSCCASGSS